MPTQSTSAAFAKVTVAVPVLNGGELLGEVITAVALQEYPGAVEILVCDSGSTDGSRSLARTLGASVIDVDPDDFAHGRTRNRMMEAASGDVVVFLTQDATPLGRHWLTQLLRGFAAGKSVALSFGPFIPRPEASIPVRRELLTFFESFSENGSVKVDYSTGNTNWRDVSSRATFFTDSNGAVLRKAWEHVPFPDVFYAEDRLMALHMLEAGYGKAYVPKAEVVHSHAYGRWALFQRYFDEFRGLRETFGHIEPSDPRRALRRVSSGVIADRDWALGPRGDGRWGLHRVLESACYHWTRVFAAFFGSRSDRLAPRIRACLSLEGRETFVSSK